MSYREKQVNKPWGYEYLAYENDYIVIWALHIKEGHKTSLHCHPNKDTGLILMKGSAEVEFISDTKFVSAPYKTMIRRGLFHATKAMSSEVVLLEVETSKNRDDLVRLEDTYEREAEGYEGEKHETDRDPNSLWIDSTIQSVRLYEFCDKKITTDRLGNNTDCEALDDLSIVVITSGGFFHTSTEYATQISKPGDVLSGTVLKRLAKRFSVPSEGTGVVIVHA